MDATPIRRWWRHALYPRPRLHRLFPRRAMQAIADAVHAAEANHHGELRVALEAALDPAQLRRGVTPRARAIELFSRLHVWDTEHNNGVLIYLLLAEPAIEIVADRGIARLVPQADWQAVCDAMQPLLQQDRALDAVLQAVDAVASLLLRHAPAHAHQRASELSDWPVVVKA